MESDINDYIEYPMTNDDIISLYDIKKVENNVCNYIVKTIFDRASKGYTYAEIPISTGVRNADATEGSTLNEIGLCDFNNVLKSVQLAFPEMKITKKPNFKFYHFSWAA